MGDDYGRPDITIATLDSGIMWNNGGRDERSALQNADQSGEAPVPNTYGRMTPLVGGEVCGELHRRLRLNDDGVFNLRDYAGDTRVNVTDSHRVGPANTLTPQDVLIAFF